MKSGLRGKKLFFEKKASSMTFGRGKSIDET
jgi:hypothetical protein